MKNALITLAEVSPGHSAQCEHMIKSIQRDDTGRYNILARRLIKHVLSMKLPMTAEQETVLAEAVREPDILTIQSILTTYNMTQAMLSKRFDIPLRTVQGWCSGMYQVPDYVLKMMNEILSSEESAEK